MSKKIKSIKVETVGKITSTVKTTTGRFNSPVTDLSPLKYATINEANIRYRALADIANILEQKSIFLSKTFLESLAASDFPQVTLSKNVADVISNVEFLDRQFKGLQKPLSDVSVSSDRNIRFVGKRFFDSVIAPDDQTFSIIKRFSDFANPVDLLTVPDGSTYNIDKTIRNTINTSDFFAYVVNFERVLEQFAYPTDDDIITFTKGLSDSVLSSEDIQSVVLDKVLKDTQLITDNDTYSLSKVLTDSSITLDNDIITFNKSLLDAVLSQDNETYSLTKVLNDTQPLSDNDTYSLTKALSENRPVLDNETYSLTKVLSEDRPALDQLTQIVFEKFLADFANPIDLLQVPDGSSYVIDKTIANFVSNITDVFDRTVDYNRTFEDTLSQYDETQVFEVLKVLTDDQNLSDFTIVDFSKTLSDEQFLSDDDVIDLIKVLSETQIVADVETIDFNKSLSDSQSLLDTQVLSFNKALSDDQLVNENKVYDFTKVLSTAQLGQSDSDVIDFTKALTDTSIQDDVITNITFTKQLSDFANPVDTIGVPDGSTYTIEKTLANFVPNITDEFNRTVDYIRSFSDSVIADFDQISLNVQPSISDSVIFLDAIEEKTLLKVLNDTPLISENKIYALTKVLSDSQSLADLESKDTIKVLNDTYSGIEDLASKTIVKSFSDFVIVTDPTFDLVRTSPALPLDDMQSIDDTGYLFMTDYVDPTYFAENYVGTERYFT